MLASPNITEGSKVFSLSLDLPEFEVVKQVFLEVCNMLHGEKNTNRSDIPVNTLVISTNDDTTKINTKFILH
jgi:hypothetical protein